MNLRCVVRKWLVFIGQKPFARNKPFVRHKSFIVLLAFISFTWCARPASATAPGVAGTLSLVPGLGQVSNGDVGEGLLWFVTTVGLFVMPSKYMSDIGFKLWEYNMYDAYRDAGPQGAAKQTVFANYLGFINPLNIADPVGLGILGYGTARALTAKSTASLGPRNKLGGAFYYGFVGLGEEGLFRGFLFPGFSSIFSSKFVGATVSSVLFSLSHLTNSQSYYHSVGGLTELFALGMALCWETNNNHNDLRHGIFTHAWYDFIIDYAGKKADGSAPATLGIKMSLPF